MKKSKPELLPIEIEKLSNQSLEPKSYLAKEQANKPIRVFTIIPNTLAEKLKDYAYSNRLTQQAILLEALEKFIKDKDISPRPEHIRNRMKTGRKSKR